MIDQNLILPGVCGILLTCITWWVNTVWNELKAERTSFAEFKVKVAAECINKAEFETLKQDFSDFKLKVAADCVAKADLEKLSDRIFLRLDDIGKEINHISRNQAQVNTLRDALRDRHDGE